MEDFFRAVAIGLGVLLGTFQQGVEPELHLSPHKVGDQVVVSGTVVRAAGPNMEQAMKEGVAMTLTLRVRLNEGPAATAAQTLVYQALSREWQVIRSDSPRVFPTLPAAEKAWAVWEDFGVGVPGPGPFTVNAEVTLSFPGRPDWRADMVWKTPQVRWRKSFTQMSEIPY